jgi:uncharacterized protein (DUF362 family)
MNRREFLAQAGAATAAVAGLPYVTSAFGPTRPDSSKSRVVVVRDEALAQDSPDPKRVRELLDEAARMLAGDARPADAWARWFKPDDRVSIKVNCLGFSTSPVVALALAEAIGSAGVAPERIILWDRSDRELKASGHTLRMSGTGVRCFGTDALASRGGEGYASEIAASGAIGSLYSRIVTEETTALASAAVLKDHNLAGLTGCLKNFYGAIHNPNKYHGNGCDPFIADVCAHPHIRGRLRLALCDATRPQYDGGPPSRPDRQWAYGGMLLATDPVALDRVALEILERKRAAAKRKSLADGNRPVRYLASAEARGLGAADLVRIEVIGIGKPWLDVG